MQNGLIQIAYLWWEYEEVLFTDLYLRTLGGFKCNLALAGNMSGWKVHSLRIKR